MVPDIIRLIIKIRIFIVNEFYYTYRKKIQINALVKTQDECDGQYQRRLYCNGHECVNPPV